MEIRWKRSTSMLVTVLVPLALALIAVSAAIGMVRAAEPPPLEVESVGRGSFAGIESGTQPDDAGHDHYHFRLPDELITTRAAGGGGGGGGAAAAAAGGQQPAKQQRPQGKETKKYRKKYVSEDDYRKSMPRVEEQQQPGAAAPDATDTATDPVAQQTSGTSKSSEPHSRKKRLIWVTDDGRLALPPGTSLTIAPTIALPFVRYPPTGFLSNISISLPITIDFDKLGLTDNQNPLGVLPPLFARSMGQAAGSVLADYVSDYMRVQRRKRSIPSSANENFKITTNRVDGDDEPSIPQLPAEHKHAFHGGERALLYVVVEDFIANFGLDGRACMLRAICEVHSKSIEKFGLVGEMLKLFFTASASPYSQHLDEYVMAEKVGRGQDGPGECFPYFKDCPRSLFRSAHNFQHKYQEPEQQHSNSERTTNRPEEHDSDERFGNEIYNDTHEAEYLVREPRASRSRSSSSSSSSINTKENTIVQLEQHDLAEMAM